MRQIHDVVDKPCVSCKVLAFGAVLSSTDYLVEVFAAQKCCAGADWFFIPISQSTRTFKRTHLP